MLCVGSVRDAGQEGPVGDPGPKGIRGRIGPIGPPGARGQSVSPYIVARGSCDVHIWLISVFIFATSFTYMISLVTGIQNEC